MNLANDELAHLVREGAPSLEVFVCFRLIRAVLAVFAELDQAGMRSHAVPMHDLRNARIDKPFSSVI